MSLENQELNNSEENNEVSSESTEQTIDVKSEQPLKSGLEEVKNITIEKLETEIEKDSALQESAENLEEVDKQAILEELKGFQSTNSTFEVEVKSKTRGGLRVSFKNYPLFLPISHFDLKKISDDKILDEYIGKSLEVNIEEIKEDELLTNVIVSRKKILTNKIWEKLEVGAKVTGKITSTPSFGVFIDLGGVEGLIHVSKLAKYRIDNPALYFKKGQELEAVIIKIDKEAGKVSLSRQELTESPWKDITETIKPETVVKGIVRRITDFGAYIELKPGADGLLKNSELSWTKRSSVADSGLKAGDKIDVYVININETKETATLSIKRVKENPWNTIGQRYSSDQVYHAKAINVNDKGVVFALNDEVDAFMPKSKLRNVFKGNEMPYTAGERYEVVITEINSDNESIILAPQGYKEEEEKIRIDKKKMDSYKTKKSSSSFTLGDLLRDSMKESLSNIKD